MPGGGSPANRGGVASALLCERGGGFGWDLGPTVGRSGWVAGGSPGTWGSALRGAGEGQGGLWLSNVLPEELLSPGAYAELMEGAR